MNKFNVGDYVLTKYTIGSMNEVVQVIQIVINKGDKFTPAGYEYLLSNNDWLPENQLELWNPKTDLEGGYKMNQISMDKKYRTRDYRDVEIIAVRVGIEYGVIGIVKGDKCYKTWTHYGKTWCNDDKCNLDLIEVNPYADFKVDDKVIVWDDSVGIKYRAYFAGVNEQGLPLTWDEGQTSWTTKGNYNYTTAYDNCVKWDGTND